MKMNVPKAFTLLREAGQKATFAAGEQDIPDDVATHWWVLMHATPVAEQQPAPEPSLTIEPDGTSHVDTPEEVSDKDALKAEAEALGIAVDGRWGVERIRAAVEAAKAEQASTVAPASAGA